jgi:hypothetical protein
MDKKRHTKGIFVEILLKNTRMAKGKEIKGQN